MHVPSCLCGRSLASLLLGVPLRKNPGIPRPDIRESFHENLRGPTPISGLFGTYCSLSSGPRELQRLISKCPRPKDQSGGCPFKGLVAILASTLPDPCCDSALPSHLYIFIYIYTPGKPCCWCFWTCRTAVQHAMAGITHDAGHVCSALKLKRPVHLGVQRERPGTLLFGNGSWQCPNAQLLSLTTSESRTATHCRVTT